MAVDGNYRYDAFISYRHIEPDREWAKWLRSALETYRVPKPLVVKGVARRVKRVFRDEEEVSAGANLSEEVQVALDASRYLIVVCSPRVVESRWCNAEIQHFRDRGWHNRILALLIEGEPYESFPPALREIRRTIVREDGERIEEVEEVEPLAADVRESPEESTRLRKGTAKLRLLARILGCRFDDLRQRDAHRRQRRLTVFASALATLVLGVGVLAAWAFFQKSRAETAERVAVDREADARERLAHSLVFQADTYAEKEDWLDAKSNYMEALGIYEELDRSTELVDMAMVEVQRHAPTSVYSYRHPKDPLHCIAASADGTLVVLGTRGGKLILWDVVAGRMEKTVGDTRMPMSCLDLSPDGKLALVGGEDGTVLLHALDANATMHTRRVGNGPVRTVRFSPDGTALLAAGADHRLTVWEVDGKERFSVDAKPLLDADWSPDGHGIATGGMPEKGLLSGTRWVPGRYWNAKTGRLSLELKPKSLADVSVRIVRFAANGEILAAVGGRIIRWRAADGGDRKGPGRFFLHRGQQRRLEVLAEPRGAGSDLDREQHRDSRHREGRGRLPARARLGRSPSPVAHVVDPSALRGTRGVQRDHDRARLLSRRRARGRLVSHPPRGPGVARRDGADRPCRGYTPGPHAVDPISR